MKIVVFLGPSLDRAEAAHELDATYLPPAAQGDVYRAARERPFAIGLVDGRFERVPAVWHKEILWAISQRIHVFGAASMGALRAAELDTFGMKGVGTIYRAFQSGELEDDDEVAVAHVGEEHGYRSVSEAMVNIRATVAGAEAAGVVSAESGRRLIDAGKSLFYPDRTYERVILAARSAGLPAQDAQAFIGHLRHGKADVKREDALLLLRELHDLVLRGVAAGEPAFHFNHTEAWDQVLTRASY